jgi:hypothetical protein
VRKRRPTLDVTAELRERYLAGRTPRPVTDREAIEEYFAAEWNPPEGGVVYESQGDGTFTGGDGEIANDDAAR